MRGILLTFVLMSFNLKAIEGELLDSINCPSIDAIYENEGPNNYVIWIRTSKDINCQVDPVRDNISDPIDILDYYNFKAAQDMKIIVNGEMVDIKLYLYEKSVVENPIIDKQGIYFEYMSEIHTLEVQYFDRYLMSQSINLKLK